MRRFNGLTNSRAVISRNYLQTSITFLLFAIYLFMLNVLAKKLEINNHVVCNRISSVELVELR